MEFFGDGDVPFDLSNLLAFRNNEFYPTRALGKVESEDLRVSNCLVVSQLLDAHVEFDLQSLIEHMIQRDPSLRLPASQYLSSLRGKGFRSGIWYVGFFLCCFCSFLRQWQKF